MFIDAGYEGDLMAGAGVHYAMGARAGPQIRRKARGGRRAHQLDAAGSVRAARRSRSGLLPLIEPGHGKPKGAGDDYTQAYNFRFYVTADPAKRVPLTPPAGYDPQQYELVGRYVEYIVREAAGDSKTMTRRLAHIFPGSQFGEYNYFRQSLIGPAAGGKPILSGRRLGGTERFQSVAAAHRLSADSTIFSPPSRAAGVPPADGRIGD